MKDLTNPDGPPAHNLSTEHQKKGDAKRPGDTLDSGKDAPAKDYDPVEDVGKAGPGGG